MPCSIPSLCPRIPTRSLPALERTFSTLLRFENTFLEEPRKNCSPYNHGNQPCLHEPWLFNFSGKPYLTQKWVRLICDEFYGITGEHGYGYGQDEDQGQLGAWYVLSTMGLFDVQGGAPAEPTYQIGSPAFDKIVVHLNPLNATGKKLVIRTIGNGPDAYYVQKASFNGKPLEQNWLYRKDILSGGELVLTMGTEPSDVWNESCPPVKQ